ncbi:MAG: hypothetical protein CVU39_14805 [Chloroflexi bacterium HGW-Chloroflexi-10]|nr:MAG: hypothetical protein CVU39_14805 [Chloroflexi bacterium HGW-Chloroflexi-10]
MKKSSSIISSIISLLDLFCYISSPLAIIGFIFMTIIHLDSYGQYRAFMKDIEKHSQTFTAAITSISEDYVFVDVTNQPDAADYYFARTKYYSKTILAELSEGDPIEILAIPESQWIHVKEPGEVILKPYNRQVQGYIGFITQGPWVVWLLFLIIISIHPEFLYIGFDIDWHQSQAKTTEQQS